MSKLVYSVLFVIHLCQNTFFPIGLGALAGGVSGGCVAFIHYGISGGDRIEQYIRGDICRSAAEAFLCLLNKIS